MKKEKIEQLSHSKEEREIKILYNKTKQKNRK